MVYNKVRAEAAFGGAKICLGEKTYCLYHILFSNGNMEKPFTIENGQLLIRYRDGVYIRAVEYTVLQGDFKFRGEK